MWSALAAAALSFVQFYPDGGDFEVGDGDAPDLSDDMLLVRARTLNPALVLGSRRSAAGRGQSARVAAAGRVGVS